MASSSKKSSSVRAREKREAKLFREKVKEMRPYLYWARDIDLRQPLTSGQKSAITKAYDDFQELTSRPVKVYRPRKKGRLEIAQQFARHEKGRTKFNVAFIPVADVKSKVVFKKDRMQVKTKYVTEEYLFFDLTRLAEAPELEIARTLARNPEAKSFIIMAGKYLWNGTIDRQLVENEVLQLMQRYSPGGKKYNVNNHYKNWLFGVIAAEFTNQADLFEYRRRFESERRRVLQEKKRQRRRRKLGGS